MLSQFSAIEVVGVEYGFNPELATFISKLPKLHSLRIGETPSGVNLARVLEPFADSAELRTLEIAYVNVDHQCLTTVGKLKGLESFTCDIALSGEEMQALQGLAHLKFLDVLVVEDEATMPLVFPQLEELHVHDPVTLRWFSNCKKLKRLVVHGLCSDRDVSDLTSRFPQIREVSLVVDSLGSLMAMDRLRSIEKLSVSLR